MGSAATTTSAAQGSIQERAKENMNTAVSNEDMKRAADIGITVLLATQPNGPAKVPMYSNLKHAYAFASTASEDGVGAGVQAAGQGVFMSELSSDSAEATVAMAQSAVTTAAERETVKQGVDAANKNLQMPSEQATEDTLAAVMSNGADALSEPDRSKGGSR
ncbi:hypothetical protein [Halorubrum sp. SD683]|uniref:hypothetical protein n=1 Tax=Halorubrum sp. SD683 TaxID=1855873 RepID=UPI00117B033B|nr:hypothetical protein [Halorubrum sp. SD683]